MPAVYLCDVIGDGQTPETAFRPNVPAGTSFVCLMIHEERGRAVIVSPSTTLSGAGIVKLLEGATWDELRTQSRSAGPNNPRRNTINNWLAAGSYQTLPANVPTWRDVIHHITRQVNPAADLDRVYVE